MVDVTAPDLREQIDALIARAEAGERIKITRDGKPVAELWPAAGIEGDLPTLTQWMLVKAVHELAELNGGTLPGVPPGFDDSMEDEFNLDESVFARTVLED